MHSHISKPSQFQSYIHPLDISNSHGIYTITNLLFGHFHFKRYLPRIINIRVSFWGGAYQNWKFSPNFLSVSLLQHPTTIHFPSYLFNLDDSVSETMTARLLVTETLRKCVTVNSPIVFHRWIQSNPPVSKFSRMCNKFTSVWSMFTDGELHI